MPNTDIKLHYYQKALVKKLTELGFVEKSEELYLLTDQGKDYSNLLDDGLTATEKQPKTSVIIWGVRKNSHGEVEQLLNRRLRQPYYGKVGRITGKVLFGETLKEAAARELYEETGLTAMSFTLEEIYRKMRKREDGVFVQDVIFYIFFVTNFSGKLIVKTPSQENFWVTEKDLKNKEKYALYDDFELDFRTKPKKLKVWENTGIAEGF